MLLLPRAEDRVGRWNKSGVRACSGRVIVKRPAIPQAKEQISKETPKIVTPDFLSDRARRTESFIFKVLLSFSLSMMDSYRLSTFQLMERRWSQRRRRSTCICSQGTCRCSLRIRGFQNNVPRSLREMELFCFALKSAKPSLLLTV